MYLYVVHVHVWLSLNDFLVCVFCYVCVFVHVCVIGQTVFVHVHVCTLLGFFVCKEKHVIEHALLE